MGIIIFVCLLLIIMAVKALLDRDFTRLAIMLLIFVLLYIESYLKHTK